MSTVDLLLHPNRALLLSDPFKTEAKTLQKLCETLFLNVYSWLVAVSQSSVAGIRPFQNRGKNFAARTTKHQPEIEGAAGNGQKILLSKHDFSSAEEKGLSVCEDQILGVFVEAAQEVFPSLFYPHSEALGSPVIWSCCHHPWLGNNIDKYGEQTNCC